MCGYITSFLTLLLVHYQTLLAHGACYNPDRSVPSNPYFPCDTTIGAHSACCGPTDQCTENGYCFGSAGYIYRGGCTDITWQSSACAQECRDAAVDSFSNLIPCPLVNGSYSKFWCCGEREGSLEARSGCCDRSLFEFKHGLVGRVTTTTPDPSTVSLTFSYIASPPSFAASKPADLTLSTTASKFSSITTSPSSVVSSRSLSFSEPAVKVTPTPLESPSNQARPPHESQTIGLGVGVPVAVLSLFGLILLFLRERGRRIHAQKVADDAHSAAKARETEKASTTARKYELEDRRLPQELGYVPHSPEEIDSRQLHEMNGDL